MGKKKTQPQPTPSATTPAQPYSDIPFLLAVTLSPLVAGSIVVTGLTPGDMTLFTLAAVGTFCAHMAGKAFSELVALQAIRIPGVALSSIDELKRGISKQSVEAERELKQSRLKLVGGLVGAMLIIFGVASFGGHTSGALLFAAAYMLLFTRRADTPHSPRTVILHAALTMSLMVILGAIGVFCQAGIIHLQTFVIGLVPGSILAAAVIAENARFFPADYWTRSTIVVRKEMPSTRPGRLSRLYALLLIAGPLVVFVLTPAQLLPPPLMLGVLPVIWTPKLASAFTEQTIPDKAIALATAKIAAVGSVCMMAAGYLAAHT